MILTSDKHEKSVKKSRNFEKDEVLGDTMKSREIGLELRY